MLTACPSPGGGGGTSAENNCTGPEPAGTDRYSITQKFPGSYKLTVKECVQEIGNDEFNAAGTIITNFAVAEGGAALDRNRIITEIALPSTLRSIGEKGFRTHYLMSGTLTIPRNVETLAGQAFTALGSANTTAPPTVVFETGSRLTTIGNIGFLRSRLKDFTLPENLETIEAEAFSAATFSFSAASSRTLIIPAMVSKIGDRAFAYVTGITAVDIRSDRLAKPMGANFTLGNDLFQNVTGITEIKLPQTVYDSYTKAELQTIFGSSFTNYRKPDGTPYDFAAKS